MTPRVSSQARPADTPGGARPAPHGAGALRPPRRAGRRPCALAAWSGANRIARDPGAIPSPPVPDLIRDLRITPTPALRLGDRGGHRCTDRGRKDET